MFDIAELLVASPWAYVVILAIAALDAVVPVVPSETTVISAGVLAGLGELDLTAVVAAAAAGAALGDTSAYAGGRLLSGRIAPWLERNETRRRHSTRARRLLDRRGGLLIVTARFVPGGRTAVTVTAGVVRYGFRRFAGFALLAAVVWASYAGLAGYVGGRVFEEEPLLALGAALAAAAAGAAAIETGRKIRTAFAHPRRPPAGVH